MSTNTPVATPLSAEAGPEGDDALEIDFEEAVEVDLAEVSSNIAEETSQPAPAIAPSVASLGKGTTPINPAEPQI